MILLHTLSCLPLVVSTVQTHQARNPSADPVTCGLRESLHLSFEPDCGVAYPVART